MLNVAVAGLGWWGKTIVNLLRRSRKLRPVLLVEPNPAARAFGEEAGVPSVPNRIRPIGAWRNRSSWRTTKRWPSR